VLTYNSNRENWGAPGAETVVHILARRQEYVCDLKGEVEKWARALIDETLIWTPRGG